MDRGEIEIKGKGRRRAYVLAGRITEAAAPAGDPGPGSSAVGGAPDAALRGRG